MASYPLLITFLVNLVGAAAVVGPGGNHGFNIDIAENGFLLGSYFVLACWLAIGATELVAIAGSSRLAGRAGGVLARVRLPARRRWLEAAAAVVVAAAVIVPSVTGHWTPAHRESKPFADAYASSVFAALPPKAVLFILGQELTDPLIYRQVVHHERRDVVVVASDGLSTEWYRQQVSRSLGRPLPPFAGSPTLDATRVIRSLIGTRPVYMDPQTAEYLNGHLGYRTVGLLNVPAAGTGWVSPSSPAVVEQRVLAAERLAPDARSGLDGLAERLARACHVLDRGARGRTRLPRSQEPRRNAQRLLNVLRIEPTNASALQDISLLNGSG